MLFSLAVAQSATPILSSRGLCLVTSSYSDPFYALQSRQPSRSLSLNFVPSVSLPQFYFLSVQCCAVWHTARHSQAVCCCTAHLTHACLPCSVRALGGALQRWRCCGMGVSSFCSPPCPPPPRHHPLLIAIWSSQLPKPESQSFFLK